MTAISANNIKVTGDTAGLIASFRAAGPAIRNFTLDINSKLVDAFKRADKEQRVFRSGLERLGNDLTKIGTKFGLVGALPALFAAGKSYKDFADLQKLEKALGQYGSTLSEIKELAKLPNVSIEGAAQATIDLRSVGFSADFTTRSIKAFANALTLAGKSSTDLQPTLVNLQQMMSTGKVSEQDIKEMARRVPQVRKILTDAFGGDYGSKDPKVVIETIVSELEKLPPLAGGAGMAIEQLGDSFQFASATIGEMIEKSFNVSGVIGKLGDMLDNVTDHLRALSPEAQKSILAVGSLAVIVPSATLALGGLVKMLPLLATGFGLVSLPVAATVAAVSIGVAAIITNWGKVKAAFQNDGLWTNLVGIVKTSINLTVEIVKLGLNLIQGDWENFGIALKNIGANIWNGIVDTFAGGVKLVAGLLNELMYVITKLPVEFLGFKAERLNLEGFNGAIDKLTGKLKADVPDATDKVTQGFKGWSKTISNLISGGGGDGGGSGGLKGATEAVKEMTKAEYELWKINLESKHLKDAAAVKAATEEYKKLAGAIAGVNAAAIERGNKSYLTPYGQVQRDERMKWGGTVAVPKGASLGISGIAKEIHESGLGIKETISIISSLPQKAGEAFDAFGERVKKFASATQEMSRGLTQALQQAANEALVATGELLGDLMSGMGGLQNFSTKIGGVLADMVGNMGKAMIAAGTTTLALEVLMNNPWTAIAAGVAAVAVSKALKNNMQQQVGNAQGSLVKLAGGGAAYGQTLAVIGDNRNAAFNPELVAPADHVRRYIADSIKEYGGGGGRDKMEAVVRLKGPDLLLAIRRTEAMEKSLKGRNG